MTNPFEIIDARLRNIECLILDLKERKSHSKIIPEEQHSLSYQPKVCNKKSKRDPIQLKKEACNE